jgi:hypothetical protein
MGSWSSLSLTGKKVTVSMGHGDNNHRERATAQGRGKLVAGESDKGGIRSEIPSRSRLYPLSPLPSRTEVL